MQSALTMRMLLKASLMRMLLKASLVLWLVMLVEGGRKCIDCQWYRKRSEHAKDCIGTDISKNYIANKDQENLEKHEGLEIIGEVYLHTFCPSVHCIGISFNVWDSSVVGYLPM